MADLLPAESMALTVALAQVQRGEAPGDNVATMCVLALARLDGRHDWTNPQPQVEADPDDPQYAPGEREAEAEATVWKYDDVDLAERNGTCDVCLAPIGDALPGHPRMCTASVSHDPYSDGFANGGDPVEP